VQGVQPLFPQSPVPAHPVIDLGERLRAEAVDTPLRFPANLDETRLAQHPQVSRHARTGDWQQGRQLAGRDRTTREGLEDGPSASVRECPQCCFHAQKCT